MTKFEGEAIGVRGGRQKGGLPTQKERKKEMELYMKTGVHSAHEVAKNRPMIPSLPERDPHRPHVFMEFRVGQNTLGEHLHLESNVKLDNNTRGSAAKVLGSYQGGQARILPQAVYSSRCSRTESLWQHGTF